MKMSVQDFFFQNRSDEKPGENRKIKLIILFLKLKINILMSCNYVLKTLQCRD